MEPKYFLPSEIARLVLGYLKQEDCMVTYKSFLKECAHLGEYTSLLKQGMEYPTTVSGKSLVNMLQEYAHLKLRDTQAVQSSEPTRILWKQFDDVVRTIKQQVSNKQIIRPIISTASRRGRPRTLCADVSPRIAPKPPTCTLAISTIVMSPSVTGLPIGAAAQHPVAVTNQNQDYNANLANQRIPACVNTLSSIPIQPSNPSASVPNFTDRTASYKNVTVAENCNLLSDKPEGNDDISSANGEDSNSVCQIQSDFLPPDDQDVQSPECSTNNNNEHNQNVMVTDEIVDTADCTSGKIDPTVEEHFSVDDNSQMETYTAAAVLVDISNRTTPSVCESAAEQTWNSPQPMDGINGPDIEHNDNCEMTSEDDIINDEATGPILTDPVTKEITGIVSKSTMSSTSCATQPKCSSPKGENLMFFPDNVSSDLNNSSSGEVSATTVNVPKTSETAGSLDVPVPPATPSKHGQLTDPVTPLKNLSYTETESSKGRSPRRKRFLPRKRSTGGPPISGVGKSGLGKSGPARLIGPTGNDSSASRDSSVFNINEDAMDMEAFGQMLNNPLLHEKLAENINKQWHHSHDKPAPILPPPTQKREDSRLDTSIQSLEDILDIRENQMSENTISDIINMTKTDPAFDSLFQLFHADKEKFVDEEYGKEEKNKCRESLTTPPCEHALSGADRDQTTKGKTQPSTYEQQQTVQEGVIPAMPLCQDTTTDQLFRSVTDDKNDQTSSGDSEHRNFSAVSCVTVLQSVEPPLIVTSAVPTITGQALASPAFSCPQLQIHQQLLSSEQSPSASKDLLSVFPAAPSQCEQSCYGSQFGQIHPTSPLNSASTNKVNNGPSTYVSTGAETPSNECVQEPYSELTNTRLANDENSSLTITACVVKIKPLDKRISKKQTKSKDRSQSKCTKSPTTPDLPEPRSPIRRSPRNKNKASTAYMTELPASIQQNVKIKTTPKRGRPCKSSPEHNTESLTSSTKQQHKSKKSSPRPKCKIKADQKISPVNTVHRLCPSSIKCRARGKTRKTLSCVMSTVIPVDPHDDTLSVPPDDDKAPKVVASSKRNALRKIAPNLSSSRPSSTMSASDQTSSCQTVNQVSAVLGGTEACDSLPDLFIEDKETVDTTSHNNTLDNVSHDKRVANASLYKQRSSNQPKHRPTSKNRCNKVPKDKTPTSVSASHSKSSEPIIRHPIHSSTPKTGERHISFIKPKPVESTVALTHDVPISATDIASRSADSSCPAIASTSHTSPVWVTSQPLSKWSPGLSALLKMVLPRTDTEKSTMESASQKKSPISSLEKQRSTENIPGIDTSVLEKSNRGDLIISPLGKHGNITLSPCGQHVVLPPCMATTQQEQRVLMTSLIDAAQKLVDSSHPASPSSAVTWTVQASGVVTSPGIATQVNMLTAPSVSSFAMVQQRQTSTSSSAIASTVTSSSGPSVKSSANPSSSKVKITNGKTPNKSQLSPRPGCKSIKAGVVGLSNSPSPQLDTSSPYFFSPTASSLQSDDVTLSPASLVSPLPGPVSTPNNDVIAIPIGTGKVDHKGRVHVRTLDFGSDVRSYQTIVPKEQKTTIASKVVVGKVSTRPSVRSHPSKFMALQDEMEKVNQNPTIVKKGRGRRRLSADINIPTLFVDGRPGVMEHKTPNSPIETPSRSATPTNLMVTPTVSALPVVRSIVPGPHATSTIQLSGLGTPVSANPIQANLGMQGVNHSAGVYTIQHLTLISPVTSKTSTIPYIVTPSGDLLPAVMANTVTSLAMQPITSSQLKPNHFSQPLQVGHKSVQRPPLQIPLVKKLRKPKNLKQDFLKTDPVSSEIRLKLKDHVSHHKISEATPDSFIDSDKISNSEVTSENERAVFVDQQSTTNLYDRLATPRHRGGSGDGQYELTTVDLSQLIDRPTYTRTDTATKSGPTSSQSSKTASRKRPASDNREKGTEVKKRKSSKEVDLSRLNVDMFLSSLYNK